MKGSGGLKTYEIIVSNSKKETQLVITKKNNETDQKLTEIVFRE